MPLSWRTTVMFLPISSSPPKGTTCKVLSSSSSGYLLDVEAPGFRLQEDLLMPDA
jgi:hypothetical protein